MKRTIPRVHSTLEHFLGFFMLTLVILLVSCGGGTRGTGDTNSSMSGYVKDIDKQPVSQLTITDQASGNSTSTDQLGFFSLGVLPVNDVVALDLESESFQSSVEVDVSQGNSDTDFQVNVIIDRTSGVVVEAQIVSQETNEPEEEEEISQVIEGRIESRNGTPLRKVRVEDAASGAADETDMRGQFSLVRRARSSSARLLFTYRGHRGEINLSGFPVDRDSLISLRLVLSIETSQPLPGGGGGKTLVRVKVKEVMIH